MIIVAKVEPERLDYVYHLPIFFDGLLERAEPFTTIATVGLRDMINAARGKEPSLLRPTIPVIIVPIRRCFQTRDNVIMARAINMLQLIIRSTVSPAAFEAQRAMRRLSLEPHCGPRFVHVGRAGRRVGAHPRSTPFARRDHHRPCRRCSRCGRRGAWSRRSAKAAKTSDKTKRGTCEPSGGLCASTERSLTHPGLELGIPAPGGHVHRAPGRRHQALPWHAAGRGGGVKSECFRFITPASRRGRRPPCHRSAPPPPSHGALMGGRSGRTCAADHEMRR